MLHSFFFRSERIFINILCLFGCNSQSGFKWKHRMVKIIWCTLHFKANAKYIFPFKRWECKETKSILVLPLKCSVKFHLQMLFKLTLMCPLTAKLGSARARVWWHKALCVLLLLDEIRLRKKAFTRQKGEERTTRCLLRSDLFNLSICAKLDDLQFFLEADFNSAKYYKENPIWYKLEP